MGIVLKPFAWLLLFFYEFLHSYGLALILFGIVVKTILFPVTLKSKKSMIQTSMLSGKMQQLQKQYGKDRERYNMEVQKLYEREKVNPMSGCLWSLIPMIVLIALYAVVRQPMTYFMDLTIKQIDQIAVALNWEDVAVANGWVTAKAMASALEKIAEDPSISLINTTGAFNQLHLISMITAENLPQLQSLVGGGESMFVMNTQFLGMDLAAVPNWKFWQGGMNWNSIGLFLLPLISVVASFLSMKVSMATNSMNQENKNAQMETSNKVMMWMMPVMSLWIGFTVPAGLSIYWITQYLIQMVQEVISAKMLKKDYEAARKASEENLRREKEEEKARKEKARLERAQRAEEAKKHHKKAPKKKDEEPDQEGVNKDDSREGLRAYARGRAYIPGRFGEVTAYHDPTQAVKALEEAAEGKKKKKKSKTEEEKPAEVKEETKQLPDSTQAPAEAAPAEEKTEAPAEDQNKEV